MSRYQLPVLPKIEATMPHAECYVGWDNGLQTYFGQVLDPDRPEDQDEVVFWIGTRAEEVQDIVVFRHLMQPWVQIPMETMVLLLADRRHAAPLTPLQAQMLAVLKGETP